MFQNPGITSKNIPVITCLRGLATVMVCMHHYVAKNEYIHNTVIKSIFSLGRCGIPMFFVISGIGISLSMIRGGYRYRSWGNFMLKRLIRIEPPYLACIVLAILYFQVRKSVPTSSDFDLMPGPWDLILHLGYLVPFFNGKWVLDIFWTLAVEFQYYIILSLLLPLVLNGVKAYRYCFYLIFLVFPFLLPHIRFFPVYAPLFLVGILYTFLQMNIIESKEYLITMLLCITVSVMVLPVFNAITALLIIQVIYFLPNLTHKVPEFLGTISYSLYLLHQITGKALINLLSYRFKEGYQKPFVIITGFIVAVVSAYIFYRIIERPSHKLSEKIKYNPAKPH